MFSRQSFLACAIALALVGCGNGVPTDPNGNNGNNGGNNGGGTQRVGSISVVPGTLQLQPGERSTLYATVLDQNGVPFSRAVTWQSSNTSIATVSVQGEVVGISAGDVTISAIAEGRQGSAYATVRTIPTTATIVVNNQLIYPISISIAGQSQGTVPAQSTRQLPNVPLSTTNLSWDLVRPMLGNTPLGEQMSGVFSFNLTGGATRTLTVDNHVGLTPYFAPLVTNLTSQALLMTVNYGLQSELRCNCVAPVGSSRVHLGYYRLFSNSNMTVFRNSSNYTGSYRYFDTFANSVTSGSGTIEFTFTTAP